MEPYSSLDRYYQQKLSIDKKIKKLFINKKMFILKSRQ